MGVLTREEILKEIRQGTIEIDPFEEDQVGPGSIDLRLGNEFRVFKKLRNACAVEDHITLEDLGRPHRTYRDKGFVHPDARRNRLRNHP